MKYLEYTENSVNQYFWRTYTKKEIDYIEEKNNKYMGYEFKWNKDKMKIPKEFLDKYLNSSVKLINKDNYLDFIT